MNEIIKRDVSLANRRMSNKYHEKFIKKLKEKNMKLYKEIIEELKPDWKYLHSKREEDIELAQRAFRTPKYKGMITNDACGRNPQKFNNLLQNAKCGCKYPNLPCMSSDCDCLIHRCSSD